MSSDAQPSISKLFISFLRLGLTAFAAMLALMPLALLISVSSQMQQLIAIAVIGGFIFAMPLLLRKAVSRWAGVLLVSIGFIVMFIRRFSEMKSE